VWGVEFLNEQIWGSEWVRCKIFELVRGWNNKRSWKPPKAYLHLIHHHHYARNRHAKGLLMKGCHARGTSMEGSHVVSLAITQVSLQLTCQVNLSKAMVIVNKDEVFYDCAKSFIIWETFWFYVWSFSMFVSSLCTFCCKVCNFVQTLVEI
jgi:hypothetical protein